MAKFSRREARIRRHLRIRKKLAGTAECPRLDVYRSLENIYAQVIDDDLGVTLVAASNIDRKLRGEMDGKNKSEQSKLVGKAIAERALAAGITTVVFDRGGFQYVGRVKALTDAAREAGLKF